MSLVRVGTSFLLTHFHSFMPTKFNFNIFISYYIDRYNLKTICKQKSLTEPDILQFWTKRNVCFISLNDTAFFT